MKIILLSLFLLIQSLNTYGATTETAYTNLFYAEMGKKSGEDVVVLTNSTNSKNCPSTYKYAWRGFLSLGEIKVSKDLCWTASEKSPDITIYDPQAVLFKTSKISQDKFIKIKTDEERKAEENNASLNERIRAIHNLNTSNRSQIDEPLLLNVNGNLTPCIRVGSILDCN